MSRKLRHAEIRVDDAAVGREPFGRPVVNLLAEMQDDRAVALAAHGSLVVADAGPAAPRGRYPSHPSRVMRVAAWWEGPAAGSSRRSRLGSVASATATLSNFWIPSGRSAAISSRYPAIPRNSRWPRA